MTRTKMNTESTLLSHIHRKINFKTKPLQALGVLEKLGQKICLIQQTLSPKLVRPEIVVFAADHGIAQSGVSAYPAEVTHQMVLNFLNGGAAINVFARQHEIHLTIVDAGVNHVFEKLDNLHDCKVNYGTQNFTATPAMTQQELEKCFEHARFLIQKIAKNQTNIIGFGEMGIGNTSSATMLMHKLLELPLEDCIGRGTGIDDATLDRKYHLLKRASKKFNPKNTMGILQTFGGFEIAMMAHAMQVAAQLNMIILVDGFIASAAFLVAYQLDPTIFDKAIFCHQSDERGHKNMLEQLSIKPILNLHLRLGEGTGCALAYPIIESAVCFINEMASFESAHVTGL